MYELRIERVIHATHAIRLYDGSLEEPHAHDWAVFVYVASAELDAIEVVMDFHELEAIVDGVLAPLSGADFNAHEAFAEVNPTAERVAEHIYKAIAAELPDRVTLSKVTVTEAPGCRATYSA
jgi:6-pyruvoyl-tetrahydropterin synthase